MATDQEIYQVYLTFRLIGISCLLGVALLFGFNLSQILMAIAALIFILWLKKRGELRRGR